MTIYSAPSRRRFLQATGAAIGAAALPFHVLAAGFPEHNISVYVPTREGGGADRLLRAVTGVWKNHLKTNFEPGFYPGAAGRVGYETYMGKAAADGHHLLFGNMGPEVLNWVVKKPTFKLDDYFYFGRVDVDPSTVFVKADSPFKTIDDVVAAGKTRTLKVATSRLAHPASIGILAIGEHTGAKFNLVPLSGGRNTIAGVVTGELDLGVLPASSVARQGTKVLSTLLVFDDKNSLGDQLSSMGKPAPTANGHFGTKLPPLLSARAFGIKHEVIEKHADRFKLLEDTLKQTFADPAFKEAIKKAKVPWEQIEYGDRGQCAAYVKQITEIGERFKPLLTGEKKS